MNGLYSSNIAIETNNISIYGPNTAVKGTDTRSAEANFTGTITVGLNSQFISIDDNDPASCIAAGEVCESYYKDLGTYTAQSNATYVSKIQAMNTAEENATYDWYIRTSLNKNNAGSHPNAASTKDGLYGSEIDPTVPFITYTFTVSADAPEGSVIPVAITSGCAKITPIATAQLAFKYYTKPGTGTTSANIAADQFDVSNAVATAKVGEDPCANGHPSTTATEEIITAETCTVDGLKKVTYTCDECGKVDKTEEVVIPAAHKYDAVVTAPNCVEAGYTTYTCSACGDNYTTDAVDALGHTEGEAVVENEVAASCNTDGSYDNVVYCTVCNEELDRDTITVDALGHTEGEVQVENKVDPDCVKDGSYDNVIYCTVCNEELDRDTITVDALGHKYDKEVTDPTCVDKGFTTYTCTVCDDEYIADYVDALGHTELPAVKENEVDPDCVNKGSYDSVVYCTVCNAEISRETFTLELADHTEGEVKVENNVAPTCTAKGSYDNVVYCTKCNKELSRETVEVKELGHTPAEAVEENRTESTCTVAGS